MVLESWWGAIYTDIPLVLVFLPVNSCLIQSLDMPDQWQGCLLPMAPPRDPWGQLINSFSKFALQISSYVLWLRERVTSMTSWLWWPQQSSQGAVRVTVTSLKGFQRSRMLPWWQRHRSIQRKKHSRIEKFTSSKIIHTVVSNGREEEDRMISMRGKNPITFVAIKEKYTFFQLQSCQIWQILMGTFLWTFRFNLGSPINKLV